MRQMLKDLSTGAVAAIVVLALFVALGIGAWVFRVATADIKGKGDQIIQTKGNADYRIAAYDAFFDQCASVQAKEDAIAVQTESLALYEKGSADFIRISTNIVALKATRASLIRQYNADAAKADTRGNFLASNLPYQLDVAQENTTCAA